VRRQGHRASPGGRRFRSLRVAALIAACAALGRGAQPEEVLHRALERLHASTRTFSKYACVETVERRYFEPAPGFAPAAGAAPRSCSQVPAGGGENAGRLEAVDRLRLDVTVSDGREIYSWPGATRFDTRDVGDIIREGPIGTGSFGTHLLAVFNNPRVRYEFAGEQTAAGRRLLEYRFHVPLDASQYRVRAGAFTRAIAYGGSFWLDADSLDLRRLALHAENLPAETSICGLGAELDYTAAPAGGAGFLLATQTELQIVFDSGRRTSNLTKFSACREYTAESEIVFEDETPAAVNAAASRAQRASVALPLGLPVKLAIEAPIDTGTAAAGDPVSARVVQAVRRPGSGEVLIPAGATVRGRLTRVEHHFLPEPYFLVAMSFNRLDWQDGSSRFAARAEENEQLARQLGASLSTENGGMRYWDVGVFLFPTSKSHYVVPAGFESKWITLATRGRS